MTLNEVWPKYIEHKRSYVRPSTLSNYMGIWDMISYWFGNLDVNAIKTKDVEKWCLEQLRTTAKKTIEDRLTLVNNMIDFAAYEFEIPVTRIVRKYIRWPKSGEAVANMEAQTIYTPEELRRIIEYVAENPLPLNILIAVMIATGIRIGEASALTYDDVDEKAGAISITKTIQRISLTRGQSLVDDEYLSAFNIQVISRSKNSAVILGTPKSSAGVRMVPLHKELLKALTAFKRLYPGHYYLSSNSPKPMEPRTIRSQYEHLIIEKVGLSRCLKPHALRHTFASMLVTSKIDVRTVSELLGHADTATTLQVYCHASGESKRRAIGASIGKQFERIKRLKG